MNIKDNLHTAQNALAEIDTAALDARLLMQEAINKPHNFLITDADYELSEQQQQKFNELIAERKKRRPVSHILGKKEFWGMEFAVNEHVLTPRPETELIIEQATKLFNLQENISILDLGTGSGCIAISLAKEFVNAQVTAIDISKEALAIAELNAYNMHIRNVKFIQSNWFDSLDQNNFDLIVSNPPYIPSSSLQTLEPELGFEPNLALTDNKDGLNCYREIAKNLGDFNFKFALFEIGIDQEKLIIEIFENYNLKYLTTTTDLAGIPRVLTFRK